MKPDLFKAYPVPTTVKHPLLDSYLRQDAPTHYQRGLHGGIDIPAAEGNAVKAVRSGIVVKVGNVWGAAYGNQVLLKHSWWAAGEKIVRYSFYAHLQAFSVAPLDKVTAGTTIGRAGATGQTTGPHVHFEFHSSPLWKEGLINPFEHLEAARKTRLARGK
jgi:murein DD-endopeptidase MepM/ murein hydrolase activator NlpD